MLLLVTFSAITSVFGLTNALLFASFIAVLLYLRHKRKYSFWSSRGVKGPTPWPFFGNAFETFFSSYIDVDLRNQKKYGNFYGCVDWRGNEGTLAAGASVFEGDTPNLIISDPHILETFLVKEFSSYSDHVGPFGPDPVDSKNLLALSGNDWRRVRAVVTSALSTSKLKVTFEKAKSCTDSLLKYLDEAVTGQRDIDLIDTFGLFVVDVTAKNLGSFELNSFANPTNQFYENARQIFSFTSLQTFLLKNCPTFILMRINLGFIGEECSKYFKQTIEHLITDRKQSGKKYPDLLQHLIDAQINSKSDKSNYLNEDELLANAITIIGASFDTTTTSLGFAVYQLALNPEIQEKVFEEIRSVVRPNGQLDFELVNKLHLLEAVLFESLRLHPADIRGIRRPVEDVVLNGVEIPKGTVIQYLGYVVQHDPENFADPEKFDPTRFLPENRDNIKPCTFLAFGSGPRMCPGNRLALMVSKLALARVLQKFTFVKTSKTKVPPELVPGSLMNIPKSLNVRVERRSE